MRCRVTQGGSHETHLSSLSMIKPNFWCFLAINSSYYTVINGQYQQSSTCYNCSEKTFMQLEMCFMKRFRSPFLPHNWLCVLVGQIRNTLLDGKTSTPFKRCVKNEKVHKTFLRVNAIVQFGENARGQGAVCADCTSVCVRGSVGDKFSCRRTTVSHPAQFNNPQQQ